MENAALTEQVARLKAELKTVIAQAHDPFFTPHSHTFAAFCNSANGTGTFACNALQHMC